MAARPRKEVDLSSYAGRFAERLKTLRLKAKLSHEQMADALGTTPTTIYRWESGKIQPHILDLPKIAAVLRISKARLILPDE